MQHKNAKPRRTPLPPHPLPSRPDILLQLPNRILQRRPRIVHLVHNQHVLPQQILHLAQTGQIEPLGPGHFCAGGFNDLIIINGRGRGGRVGGSGREGFVEGETNGLDGYVGGAGPFEEGAEDAGGDVAAAADGDHEVWVEGGEGGGGGGLAEFVDLSGLVSFFWFGFSFLGVWVEEGRNPANIAGRFWELYGQRRGEWEFEMRCGW